MKDTSRQTAIAPRTIVRTVAFWLNLSSLVFVPLAYSAPVSRTFSLPKFLILFTGCVAPIPLIALVGVYAVRHSMGRPGLKHLLL